MILILALKKGAKSPFLRNVFVTHSDKFPTIWGQ